MTRFWVVVFLIVFVLALLVNALTFPYCLMLV